VTEVWLSSGYLYDVSGEEPESPVTSRFTARPPGLPSPGVSRMSRPPRPSTPRREERLRYGSGNMLYRFLALWDRYPALTAGVVIVGALGVGAYLLEHLVAH